LRDVPYEVFGLVDGFLKVLCGIWCVLQRPAAPAARMDAPLII
jgi:hypothetical protein